MPGTYIKHLMHTDVSFSVAIVVLGEIWEKIATSTCIFWPN